MKTFLGPLGAFYDLCPASAYIRKAAVKKMQENYPMDSGYGTAFTTSVTPGYGTINPGPGSIPSFMGAAPRGEMMGTASDGSSLAAYAPIVHAMPTRLFTNKGRRFVPEGTLLRIYSLGTRGDNSKMAHADCASGDDYVLLGLESGVKDASTDAGVTFNVSGLEPDYFDNLTPFYRPTASGSNGGGTKLDTNYVDTISLALQSVTRVRLEGIRPPGQATWAAGTAIYVQDDGTDFHLSTDKTGAKACLGVTTLPCDPTHEDWFYLCLRPDLRAMD